MTADTRLATPLLAIDPDRLPRVLAAGGFAPPAGGFLALVVEVRDVPGGLVLRAWDWHGSSRATDWWPASTIKVFVAAAALASARRRGFTPAALARFDGPAGPFEATIEALVRAALTPSDNEAFDRLAWVAGHGTLRRWLARHGFGDTSLWRGYSGLCKDPVTGRGTLADAPPVRLEEGARCVSLPARRDRAPCDVPDHGNRTTLRDLAGCLLRIARHGAVPPAGRLGLRRSDLLVPPGDRLGLRRSDAALLRDALGATRERGNGVADGLRSAFGPDVRILHKPGFACDWFSDVAFVDRPAPGPSWLVAMAGRSGRDCLDDAARRVGDLLVAGGPGA